MPILSVVIPVYKAERTLPELYARIVKSLESACPDFELIFVDDYGGDRSWELIEGLARTDKRVKGVRLSRNFGQHAATICGFARAEGQWVATLDDDLEHPPEDLPALLEKAREGYDIVYGIFEERTHAAWRNLTSALARRLFAIAIPNLNREYSSFRVIVGQAARTVTGFTSPFPFVDGYLSWVTNRYATVPVTHGRREPGGSRYSFAKLLTHTLNIFVTFSDLPLKLASWLGLLFFALGGLGATGIILARLLGRITVSGYASLMVGLLVLSGIQMLMLGIFGEYLSRINFKTSQMPLFLVGSEVGFTVDPVRKEVAL